MKNGHRIGGYIGSALLLGICGCGWFGHGGSSPQALAPDQFYRSQPPGTIESRQAQADKPGELYNDVHMDPIRKDPNPLSINKPKPAPESVTTVSPESRAIAAERLTELPATRPVALPLPTITAKPSNGQYMTIGAVVVEVNGQPIYADKVLRSLERVFATEARQRDEQGFRNFAENEIVRQVYAFVNDELAYAMAEHVLDKQEKDFADQLTQRWQDQQKTAAGGSIQQVRAKFAAEGIDFNEALKDNYRQNMYAIYLEKKIRPKVQVGAEDMRRYYEKHWQTEFAEADSVQYRLITINVAKSGSREAALKRIQEIEDRAKKGEDFQSLATRFNDDARLARSGGLETPVQRGTLRNEKLNDAVFATKQGQLTGIIDSGDAFHLAKLEMVKTGRVMPFDDPAVQRTIKEILSKQQMEPLTTRERERQLANSVMVPNPPLYDPLIEMAMQKYPQWAAVKESPSTRP